MNHQNQSQLPAQASSKASVELQGADEACAEYLSEDADAVIERAIEILRQRLRRPGCKLSSPRAVMDFLRLRLANLEREEFHVLFLDVKNRLLADDVMFVGTLTHTSVHPREVVKAALKYNAAGVILAHNHPSGENEPSEADLLMTKTLVQALALVEVRVLDHIIIAGVSAHSFAEHGEV
jgi:DNA repair protein RadC